MQLLCYWFAFRSFCFADDLNYSVIRVDPGAAVDSSSDKGKENELLCHLIFVSNTIQRRQYFSWHTSLSWEKHKINFTHRKQFLDRNHAVPKFNKTLANFSGLLVGCILTSLLSWPCCSIRFYSHPSSIIMSFSTDYLVLVCKYMVCQN